MFSGFNEIVQTLLLAKPFIPFEMWSGDKHLLIRSSEDVRAVDEDYSTLAVYDPETDHTNLINMIAVDRVRIHGRRLKF